MTAAALVMSMLFFVIFSNQNFLPSYFTTQSTNIRVKIIDSYVKNIPDYVGDALEIATYAALTSGYNIFASTGTFLSDETTFKDLLYNCIECGSISCPGGASCQMNGKDMRSLLANMTYLAREHLNINSTITVRIINVTQNYPFDIDIMAEITYNASDPELGYASWKRIENISRFISIIDLYDPLIGISTSKLKEKVILKTDICAFNETCWDIPNVKLFYLEQKFRYSPNGTSFLSRFWNSNLSSTCCGIESFMLVSDVSDANKAISYLDHYYYSGVHNCSYDTILNYNTSIATNFSLDSKTAARYRISDNGTMLCRP